MKNKMKSEVVKEFKSNGLNIMIRKMSQNTKETNRLIDLGVDITPYDNYYCGYVEIDDKEVISVLEPMEYDTPFQVHGGVTWNAKIDNKYYIGFDCVHLGDDIKIQDLDYVTKECISLAEQINNFETSNKGKIK